MAQNHIQQGQVMTWANGTGSAVNSGDVVEVGTLIGVALGNIADGTEGELAIAQVFELPKVAATAIDQGAAVYWDDSAGEIGVTDSNTYAGKCFAQAAASDTTVEVLLNV